MTDNAVTESIYAAIDEFNAQNPGAAQLQKAPETVLFGAEGRLDSLGLVNLIVAVEQRIQEDFGVTVTLADERAFSQRQSPFRTIATLASYIGGLIEERRRG